MTGKNEALFTMGEVGEILGSAKEGDSEFQLTPLSGIEIDSRKVQQGFLFVAVRGEKHDGHDYLESAFSSGAVAAVVSKAEAAARGLGDHKYITVDDTVFALGELARKYRQQFDAKIVAVTGSNGKTTVKNLIYEITSDYDSSLKSEKNYNNFFGLPLSIFKLTRGHRFAVFELGMSAAGEIARLAEIASPDFGMITNVGPAHLEFFDDVESIAEAKMEIVGGIKKGGALLLNGDDDLLMRKAGGLDIPIKTFGLTDGNDVHPTDLKFDENRLSSFTIEGMKIRSLLPGVHNVYNILAAFAAARAVGIDPEIASDALGRYRSGELRSEVIHKGGTTFIIDCYNANPVSMKYAIDTLAAMKCRGRRIAVLGDMLELGKRSEQYHREIGIYANETGVDNLFCYGPLSRAAAEAFGEKGRHFEEKSRLIDELIEFTGTDDIVLFKASRGIALEDVAESVMGAI